jgi:hypothetical protein
VHVVDAAFIASIGAVNPTPTTIAKRPARQ